MRTWNRTKAKRELLNTTGLIECNICHEHKTVDNFAKDKVKALGYKLQCKQCQKHIRQVAKVFEQPKKKSLFKRITEFFGVVL